MTAVHDPRHLVERVVREVTERGLFGRGARLVVACSGGPDSTALLHILHRFPEAWRLELVVAHVQHGLREDAEADAAFVGDLAQSLGIPVYVERLTGLDPSSPNLEARARTLRYEALSRIASRVGAPFVATGHTLDDQAETVLLRLVRGTGVAGLAGIAPRRPLEGGVEVVRPLLWTRREELRAFLQALRIPWREDPTNRDLGRQRNRVRHLLIPALERENPRVREALGHLADIVREEEAWWTDQLAALREALVVRQGDAEVRVDRIGFRELAPALQRRLLRELLGRVAEEAELSFAHVEGVREAAREATSGGEIELPGGVRVRLSRDLLILSGRPLAPPPRVEVPIPVPGRALSTDLGLMVEASLEPADRPVAGSGEWEVEFDPSVANRGLVLRNRRPGDRIRLRAGRRKLQDVLTDVGVPRWDRDYVGIVATQDGEVVWVIGYCAAVLPRPREGVSLRLRAWRLEAHGASEGRCYNGAAGGAL
jgi:tRNA(Ile)-lysidine synthase